MATIVQWVHVSAAVIGVGGMGFLLYMLLPSVNGMLVEQRDYLLKRVLGKFRWVSWAVIILLLGSGLYNVKLYYWELSWGWTWRLLTVKIALAFAVFGISLLLTLPFGFLNRVRARREAWLATAFWIALVVILISAYLRRA